MFVNVQSETVRIAYFNIVEIKNINNYFTQQEGEYLFWMTTIRQRTIDKIWSKAKKHYAASHPGLPGDVENYELCECCDQPVVKDPISMWQHTKEFQIFGFGYPLFYSFLKYCILLVLVLIATRTGSEIYMATKENYDFCYGSHEIAQSGGHPHHFAGYENGRSMLRHYSQEHHPSPSQQHPHEQSSHPSVEGHQQHHAQCTSFMIYLSIFQGQQTYNNEFLRILSFIIHAIALFGIRSSMLKQAEYYDQRTCSLSDYSVIVSNLPKVHGVRKMVLNLFQNEFGKTYGTKDAHIKQVIYAFESKRLKQLQKQKHKLQKQHLQAIEYNDQHQAKHIQTQIQASEQAIHQRLVKLRGYIQNDEVKCDKVIVVLNTEEDKGDVLGAFGEGKKMGRDYAEYFVTEGGDAKKTKIVIKQAVEPNELNWKHIDESDTQRSFLILRGYLFTFLFLAIVTVAFYFIMLAKTNLFVSAIQMQHHNPHDPQVQQNKTFATIIVFVALFGVILFNKFIMGKVLHKFVHMQRHAYTDKQSHSFAMKYSLGMFFTTALMTLAVEAITFKNFYSHQYGVIEQQTIMFFVTAFFIPLVWLINPYNIAKKIELKMHEHKIVRQQKANQLIEDFPYDLGKRYAEIFEIMWFTFLYSQLIPLGSFLIVIGLALYYWVDKFNFLRRSALKGGVSGKMSLLSLKSLDATLFLPQAGRALFSYVMHNETDYLSMILTSLGIIYLLLPVSEIIWKVNAQKFMLQEKPYDAVKYSFKEHYITLHPVYKWVYRDEIKQYRKNVSQYYKEEYAKHHLFATGRGSFKKDNRKQSKINTMSDVKN